MNGKVVRKLKTSASKGVKRIHWDGRYPTVSPISLGGSSFDNPFAGEDVGIPVMPGDYTVSLARSVNGQITDLVEPQKFTLKTLGGVTLPAKDHAALVAFQNEAQDLSRIVDGAGRMMGEIGNKMRHIEKAVYSIPAPTPALLAEIKNINDELKAIQKEFYGDNIASKLDKGQKFTAANRIGWLTYEMWNSSSAPTNTQKQALKLAKRDFEPIMKRIKKLYNQDIKSLEQKLDAAGAPYTPGRDIKYGNY